MSDFRKKIMDLAFTHSNMSNDPSTKVGAVVTLGDTVVSLGYNHIAKGIPYTQAQLLDREWKYPRVIHAEADVILRMSSTRLYQQRWEEPFHIHVTHYPCEKCAALIIQSGIKEVFTHKVMPDLLARWPGMKIAADMFMEAKIPVNFPDI